MSDLTYQKHNSFVEIRHHSTLSNVRNRIQVVCDTLAGSNLSEYQQKVVQAACEEILGKAQGIQQCSAFALQTYVTEEVNRLRDEELPRYLLYRYRYEMY